MYYRNVPPEHQFVIRGLDERLTEISDSTCEFCGREGERRDTGWEKTMCDDCFSVWRENKDFKPLYEKYG